jgi:hypothetical protein
MHRFFFIGFLMLALISCDLKTVTDALGESGEVTEGEVAKGLKEALKKGIIQGAAELARENGYYDSPYKILLPEEAQKVAEKLRVVPGFSDFEDEMVLRLNRAAEDAANEARPIFVNAITSMTIGDAWNILKGQDNAATMYLKDKTYVQLYDAFQPKVMNSLNKVNAVDYWEKAITKYNSLPLVKDINPRLDDYVTNEALDGLFSKIEGVEQDIRENPVARTTELLKRVFAKQD